MPAQHAPTGGTTIRGVEYRGGQFVPADVVDSLSPEEKQQAGLQSGGGETDIREHGYPSHFIRQDHLHPLAVYGQHMAKYFPDGKSHPLFNGDDVIAKFDEKADEYDADVDHDTEAERAEAFDNAHHDTAAHFDAIADAYNEALAEAEKLPGFDETEFNDTLAEHFDADDDYPENTIETGLEKYKEHLAENAEQADAEEQDRVKDELRDSTDEDDWIDDHIDDLFDGHREAAEGEPHERTKKAATKTKKAIAALKNGFDDYAAAMKGLDGFDADEFRGRLRDGFDGTPGSLSAVAEAYKEDLNKPADRFAATYFERDTADDRVGAFIDAMDGGKFSAGDLDDDTRQAIAEDLANWSNDPSDLLAYATAALDRDDPDELGIVKKALEIAPEGKVSAFDPEKPYRIYDLADEPGGWHDELLPLMARHSGIVWQSADGQRFVVQYDHHTGGHEMPESASIELDSEDGLQKMFDDLPNPTVREADVPASAKNTGRVSGGQNVRVEDDWHPDNVDVFKPVSTKFYLLRRGDHSPEVAAGGLKYEVVPRGTTGQRAGLPPQYWEGLTATDPYEYDADAAERKAATRDRQGSDARGRARSEREKLKRFKGSYGKLADRHNRLLQADHSAEQHEAKAKQAIDDFDGGFASLSGTKMAAAHEAVTQSLEDVYHLDRPEIPDFTLDSVREAIDDADRYNEGDDRGKAADHLTKVRTGVEKEQAGFAGELAAAEAAHREHAEKLRAGWQKAYDAAADAIKLARNYDPDEDADADGDTLDPDDVRENLRLAVKAARVAKWQLAKLIRGKLLAAPKTFADRRTPHSRRAA